MAFVAVESEDELSADEVTEKAALQIRSAAEKLGVGTIMVYPYSHLSSDLAKPRIAKQVVAQVAEALRMGAGLETRDITIHSDWSS